MDSFFASLSAAAAVAALSCGCGSAANAPSPGDASGGVGAGGGDGGAASVGSGGTAGEGGSGGRPFEGCSADTWSHLVQSSSPYSAGAPRVAIGEDCSVLLVGGFHGTIDLGGDPLVAGGPDDGAHGSTFFVRYDSQGHHLASRQLDPQAYYEIATTPTGFVLSGSMYTPDPDAVAGDLGCGSIPRTGLFTPVVAMFDHGGACLWNRALPAGVDLIDVAIGPDEGVVLAGQFNDIIDLGTGPLVNAGYQDGFVAKLTPTGQTVWVTTFGDMWTDEVAGLAVDETGAILVGGSFFGTLDIGGAVLESAGPGAAAFLLQLSADGAYVNGRVIEGSDDSGVRLTAVATGPDGRRVAVGSFTTIDLSGEELQSEGDTDGFIIGFDASGAQTWASTFGGAGGDAVNGLAIDADGNAIVTGSFASPARFGEQWLQATGSGDGFVAKYGPSGDLVVARAFGGEFGSGERGSAVVSDDTGHAVLVGYFRGTADLGTQTGPMTSDPAWLSENFIARITLE